MVPLPRKLGGWTLQNYSMPIHVKTGGQKTSTPCAMTFGSLIPNLGIWIQGSGGCGTHVIDGLFFKFFEDTSQKIED